MILVIMFQYRTLLYGRVSNRLVGVLGAIMILVICFSIGRYCTVESVTDWSVYWGPLCF